MHDEHPTMFTARFKGWFFFLGGLLMLGISIDTYFYPRGQVVPTD
jgi:hypothetical protein